MRSFTDAAALCAAAIDSDILQRAQAKARSGLRCNRIETRQLAIEAERKQNLALAQFYGESR